MRENLKNVVLYLVSSRLLVSPKKDASRETLWVETWKRVDRFIPDLRNDLEPEAVPKQGIAEVSDQAVTPKPIEGAEETDEAEPRGKSRSKITEPNGTGDDVD